MRVEEAWSFRAGRLEVEHDKSLGDIFLLRGQTTKTLNDSDAMWVTSPCVEVAVRAMEVISLFRSLNRLRYSRHLPGSGNDASN